MTKENPSVVTFKTWIFPSLVSLVTLMIWNDVTTIKSDIKLLMAQSNVDKTKIENLERQIFKSSVAVPGIPIKDQEPRPNQYAILVDNRIKLIK